MAMIIRKVYGDDALSCHTVYTWYMWYKKNWELSEDDACGGGPVT